MDCELWIIYVNHSYLFKMKKCCSVIHIQTHTHTPAEF
jgi:hypothetical protein